ncbi:hypothetical protein F2Q69_00012209 [Brassica cretica]|uniref:Uncharacterized protein n=1 Tax=Brassica cretica TaxID=69181 RepID=A0A8S9QW81_BRACR|nr:hypothetical protein F2Q69_00012209 [Brassica cretica]
MVELESISDKERLPGVSLLGREVDQVKDDTVSVIAEEWNLAEGSNGGMTEDQNVKEQEGCVSPNGFQVLQDLREEGEIDGEDETHVESDEVENVDCVLDHAVQDSQTSSDPVRFPLTETGEEDEAETVVGLSRGSSARSRGRGSKKVFANSRSLVQAVSQQQKRPHQAIKASSRKH